MKFFDKQKVDQIGVTSVALQKILVFLLLLSLFTLFNGGLLSFILCLIGFIGAYKRHTGLLRAYVTISVALIIIAFVFALIASFSALSSSDYEEYSSSSSGSEYYSYSNTAKFSAATKTLYRKWNPLPTPSPGPTPSTSSNAPSDEPTSSSFEAPPVPSTSEYVEEDYTVFIFLAIAVMVLAFFVVYLKIFSLVLAYRLRKMILVAATLPTTTENTQTHEFAPANTSCAVPQQESEEAPPMPPANPLPFTQFTPGFAPYPYSYPYPMMPMMPNAGNQQLPPHVMYGQQPIFYTYAPVPTQAPASEKL